MKLILINNIIVAFLLITLSSNAFADSPFGIKMGAKIEDLNVLSKMKNGNSLLHFVPNPDTNYIIYMVKHHTETGVCMISARTNTITSFGEGKNIRTEFDRIKKGLVETYGETQTIDYVINGNKSLWEKNFMSKMAMGEAFLGAIWSYNRGNKELGEEIGKINLVVEKRGGSDFNIVLQFDLNNINDCKRNIYRESKEKSTK